MGLIARENHGIETIIYLFIYFFVVKSMHDYTQQYIKCFDVVSESLN